MAPVPVLMILYTSDAVEIRYSDGSCLELSPCGSAMIHHDAPGRREPKYGKALKVQKRTRFVTSEHRQKVAQALDFRNRFAERPYICEDLLPKDDIVALYARIESIAWPKLPEEAKIDVLPDGSRRITSLDEFASLVISPHGHDFTVCYLSRLSEEGRSRSKSSLSHQSNSRTSGKCCQCSSEKESLGKFKNLPRANGAVIQPFEKTNSSDDMQIKCSRLLWEGHHSVSSDNANKMQEGETKNIRLDNSHNSELVPATLATQHTNQAGQRLEVHTVNSKEKEQINLVNSLENNNNSSLNSTHTSDRKNNDHERHSAEHNTLPCSNGAHSKQKPKPSFPFSDACSDCQDISSISRSSTPDGLRATIDSDATLTNENMAESFHEHNPVHEKQHSSPTQYTSSPYDVQELAHSRNLERVRTNMNASLTSSFLGDQKLQNQWEDIGRDPNIGISKQLPNSLKDEFSLLADDDDCPGTVPANTHPLENAVENQFLLNLQHSDNSVGHKIQSGPDCTPNRSAEKNARILDLEANSRNVHFELESNIVSASQAKLAEKCSDISQIGQEENVESRNRERYVWTTSHCSRNQCPIAWMHPLGLALGVTKLTEGSAASQSNTNRPQGTTATLKTNEKTACAYTTVPSPLPVTCPFQHKVVHNYDEDDANENSASNFGEFQHGRLKIVISEGVVYRLVHWADMKIVEIHPGDGSVFVSEGVKGHFFTHYIVVEDQLQERTYSLKSLPRQKMEGRYSVGKLVEMGNRLVMMNNEWQQRGLKDDVPCWKREVIAVVEPLSSSLLEECHVDGLGKFSAFTNGRVRIVFEDRTALDMVCNFSRRVKECLQHSQEPMAVSLPCANSVSPPLSTVGSIFGANSGRLMLPSGKYVTVDIRKPGQYRNYIQIAQEWASWVGSSPLERHRFYSEYHTPALLQQAAEIELKKIFCFNYILEQTMLMQQEQLNSRKPDPTKDRTSQPSAQLAGVSGSKTSPPPYHNPVSGSKTSPPPCHNPVSGSKTSPPQPLPYHNFTGLHCDLQPDVPPARLQHLSKSSKTTYLHDEQNKCSRHTLPLNRIPPGSFLTCGQDKARKGSSPTCGQDKAKTGSSPTCVQDKATTMPQRDEPTSASWALRAEYISSRKTEDIITGFELVRQVLLQNSSMINDIEQFLETSRKS